MSNPISKILDAADCRFPTEAEYRVLLDYAKSLPQRIQAAQQIEAAEETMVREVIAAMQAKFPEFTKYHPNGWAKGFRDIQFVIRFMTHAMLSDDPQYPVDRIYLWMRSILLSTGMTPQFNSECYKLLRATMEKHLTPETYAQMKGHVDLAVEIFTEGYEPTMPTVGPMQPVAAV